MQTDADIVALYLQRSEKALEETQQKYGAYCRSAAYGILHDLHLAEECLNDALLRCWNSIPPHQPENLRTYLGKLVRNVAINRLEANTAAKRGGGQRVLALEELSQCLPAEDPDAIEDSLAVRHALDRFLATLSQDSRRIFVRRYWFLDSVQDIARAYGFTESKVSVSLYRTREKLRKYLTKEGILV